MSVEKKEERIQVKVGEKRRYEPPVLRQVGTVRDLTMGNSPGVGDSINPNVFKP